MVVRTEAPQMFAYQTESPAHFSVDLPPVMNVHGMPSNQAPMQAHSTTLPDRRRRRCRIMRDSILISMPLSDFLSNLFYVLGRYYLFIYYK
jgi:hypothetical protein